jgi:hypothetical protein
MKSSLSRNDQADEKFKCYVYEKILNDGEVIKICVYRFRFYHSSLLIPHFSYLTP